MSPALIALLNYLCQRVSEQDIRKFSPVDPGYPDYVDLWSSILLSRNVPRASDFDLSEVIGLTAWADPCAFAKPNRFRAYRLLTSTVACHLYLTGNSSEIVHRPNYVAIRLINDSRDLGDANVSSRLGDLLADTASHLKAQSLLEEEYPFLYAAEMIWAQRRGDFLRAESAAKAVLEEEAQVASHEWVISDHDSRFLFRLTNYDTLNGEWNRALAELVNPNDCAVTQRVIDAVRRGGAK